MNDDIIYITPFVGSKNFRFFKKAIIQKQNNILQSCKKKGKNINIPKVIKVNKS